MKINDPTPFKQIGRAVPVATHPDKKLRISGTALHFITKELEMTKRIIDQLRPGMMFSVFYRYHPRDDEFSGYVTMKVKYLMPEDNAIYVEQDGGIFFVDLDPFDYWNDPDVIQRIGRRYDFVFCIQKIEEIEGEGFELLSLGDYGDE